MREKKEEEKRETWEEIEEEMRESASLLEDVLEKEGLEDSLLLLAGVEVKREEQEELYDAVSHSLDGLGSLGIVIRPQRWKV